MNARTELAIRYNDISPLENHHCAVAFDIISQVGVIFTSLTFLRHHNGKARKLFFAKSVFFSYIVHIIDPLCDTF